MKRNVILEIRIKQLDDLGADGPADNLEFTLPDATPEQAIMVKELFERFASYVVQDADYLLHSARCPVCGSDEIVGHQIDSGESELWQEIDCSKCDHQWIDVYLLIGKDTVEQLGAEPKGQPKETP